MMKAVFLRRAISGAALHHSNWISKAVCFTQLRYSPHITGTAVADWGSSRITYGGEWTDGTSSQMNGFMGVQLSSNSFAWVQLDINRNGCGQLLAWGYETGEETLVAAGAEQAPIATPLPTAAWMLIAGLGGLAAFRRSS